MTETSRQNEADVFRNKFTEKSFKILSILLLNDKPLTTTEIAKLAGYPRTTIEPYVMRLVFTGYLTDEGRDKLHGWTINIPRKFQHEKSFVSCSVAKELRCQRNSRLMTVCSQVNLV